MHAGSAPPAGEDRLGEAMPGGVAGAGGMEDAAVARPASRSSRMRASMARWRRRGRARRWGCHAGRRRRAVPAVRPRPAAWCAGNCCRSRAKTQAVRSTDRARVAGAGRPIRRPAWCGHRRRAGWARRSRHRGRPCARRTRSRSRPGSAGCRAAAHARRSAPGPAHWRGRRRPHCPRRHRRRSRRRS